MGNITALNPLRYVADSKRILAEFLDRYINGATANADIAKLFHEWADNATHSVDVFTSNPAIPADEELAKPRIIIYLAGDDVAYTWANSSDGTTQNACEYHTMRFEINCITDEATGARITCDDLGTAVQRIFALYVNDLTDVGMSVLYRSGSREEESETPKLYLSILTVDIDVKVIGQPVRTLETSFGSFTLSATGTGTFTDGVSVDNAQGLRLKTITKIGTTPIDVTVTAKDAGAITRVLTAQIPSGTAIGGYIELTPDVAGKKYKNVTNITVTQASGSSGDRFSVVGIPAEI